MPGRICVVHCMDVTSKKFKDGHIGLKDFSGKLIETFEKNDFHYVSRVTIWKDPVVQAVRTKALTLLHKQIKKDSTMSYVGIPDYILLFRKHGENAMPVSNKDMPIEIWQKWASPVWMDINQTNTLQFRSARSEKDEKHICPLQLEVIERLVKLYSNEGETVFSPFAGIGSEGWQSLLMGRKFIGIELKGEYFEQGKKNLAAAVEKKKQVGLFESF